MGEVSAGCLHCSTAGISKNCWKGVGMHQRAPWREKKSTQKPNRCTQGAWNPAVHDMKALFCKSYCTHTRRRELSTGRQHVKLLIAAHCWPGPARHAQHMWQPDSPVNRPKQASWQNPQALFLPCTASPSPEPAQRLLCVGHSIARTHTHTPHCSMPAAATFPLAEPSIPHKTTHTTTRFARRVYAALQPSLL